MKAEKPVPMSSYDKSKYFPGPVLNQSRVNSNDQMILPEGFDNIIREILPQNPTPYKDLSYLDDAAEFEEVDSENSGKKVDFSEIYTKYN